MIATVSITTKVLPQLLQILRLTQIRSSIMDQLDLTALWELTMYVSATTPTVPHVWLILTFSLLLSRPGLHKMEFSALGLLIPKTDRHTYNLSLTRVH